MMPVIRRGSAEDLEAIAAIQYHSEGASQWNPPDYLAHDLYVAIQGSRVAGFVAARAVAGVLNPAFNVAPNNRIGDGTNTNDVPYQETIPYVGFAQSGRDRRHTDPGEAGCTMNGGSPCPIN